MAKSAKSKVGAVVFALHIIWFLKSKINVTQIRIENLSKPNV